MLQFQISDLLSQRFDHLHTGGITVRSDVRQEISFSPLLILALSCGCFLMQDMRSYLVRNTTLARFATLYGFPDQLRISSTNHESRSIKQSFDMAANIFEAYTWAVRKEHGVEESAKWLNALFGPLADLVYKDLGGRHQYSETDRER